MDFNKFNLLFRYGRDYGRESVKGIGVNDTEYNICVFLNFYGEASQDMIAKSYAFDKTTVAKALVSLEHRNLITRKVNPKNRRQNIIAITNEGRELIKDAIHIYDDWTNEIAKKLTEEEQRNFEKYLDKLLAGAEELKK